MHHTIMDRQTELLEKEDPRFYAIDKLNTELALIATTEKLNGQIVSFGLPYKDKFKEKDIVVAFIWDKTDPDIPVWSQAFAPDNGKTWEVNATNISHRAK